MTDKKNIIKQSGEGNLAVQNSEIYLTVSIFDEIENLARQGKYKEVANTLMHIKDFVGTKHPLYPHYRYKPVQFGNNIILEHEPLTKEAEKKYPITYKGEFSISKEQLGGYNGINDLLDDAFLKQKEIEINMSSLNTWLGDRLIDTPNLEKALEEGKWVIAPRALPAPLKLKLYLKENPDISIVDYLEMSISGKEGNEYIYIDNSKQVNAKLLFSVKLPINNDNKEEYYKTSNAKINLKIKPGFETNVEANLNLLYFFKLISEEKTIAFKNLQEDKDFIVAQSYSLDEEIFNLENNYNFLKRLNKIEKSLNLSFSLPKKIEKNDYDVIHILESAIENSPIGSILQKLTANFNDKKSIQNLIELFDSRKVVKKLMIEQSGPEGRIELFNEIIPIEKVQTTYNTLKIDNFERLKNKVELMEDGESIKITFLPDADPEFTEYYYIKH